jgi:hypothetical protein
MDSKRPPPPSFAETSGIELGPTNNNNNAGAQPSHSQQQQQPKDIPLTSDVAMIDNDDDTTTTNNEQQYSAEFLQHAAVTAPEDYSMNNIHKNKNNSSNSETQQTVVVIPSRQGVSPSAAAQSQAVAYQEAATMMQPQQQHNSNNQNHNHNHHNAMTSNNHNNSMTSNHNNSTMSPTRVLHRQHRRGHSFCFCLCDMHRSVIIINTVNAILAPIFIALYGFCTSAKYVEKTQALYDDDEGLNDLKWSQDSQGIVLGAMLVCWIGLLIGIRGSQTYNRFMVLTAAFVYSIFVRLSLPIAIASAFCFYPNIVLNSEIEKGIMSAECYGVEQHWCSHL